MYMKEIYVIDETSWVIDMGKYTKSIFKHVKCPELYDEIRDSFLRTMLLMICEELMKYDGMSANGDASTAHDKEIFNRFLQMLNNEPHKRQQVAIYADRLNISPKYLSSICKKVSGKNPMRWITESVMDDCYQRLKDTDMSVKEIASELGFPNASFFGQYFREQAGMTPIAYRNKHKNAEWRK
jgi:AraC-like DNA-binding protein